MAASLLVVAAISAEVKARPELTDGSVQPGPGSALVTAGLMVLALVLMLAVPATSYFPILVLLADGPVIRLLHRLEESDHDLTRGRIASRPAARSRERILVRKVHPAARSHRPGDDPQLLHHRAHRPRQVDARGPDAAADRSGRRPGRPRAVPRPDGHRARARHHDQEPGGPDALDGAGRQRRGGRARHLRAQHDRHPRPRRLHLRGVPVARGLRGGGAAGRRGAGHRGADARQPLPRAGRRPPRHPGPQQDRPPQRPAGEVRRGAGRHHRLRRVRRAPDLGQDRARRRDAAQRDRQADPGPGRRRRRPAAGADLRLGLRHLPRRRHLRPGGRRQAAATATGSR